MTNQPRLVNRTPVNVEESRASPAVSMIPQMAIRPVKMSAMSSNGFLNTVSPFCYIKEIFIKTENSLLSTFTKNVMLLKICRMLAKLQRNVKCQIENM
jgi:hypothetical protein